MTGSPFYLLSSFREAKRSSYEKRYQQITLTAKPP